MKQNLPCLVTRHQVTTRIHLQVQTESKIFLYIASITNFEIFLFQDL